MPDTKLSALTELAATPADNDEVYIRDVSEAAAAESKRITVANLRNAAMGIKLDDFTTPDDNTDLNASTTKHGLLPKLNNVATDFLNGQGGWSAPAGGGGATLIVSKTEVFSGTNPTSWTDLDLSGTVGSNVALVLLSIFKAGSNTAAFRANGDTDEFFTSENTLTGGVATVLMEAVIHIAVLVATDSSGIIEWKGEFGEAGTTIDILAYIK